MLYVTVLYYILLYRIILYYIVFYYIIYCMSWYIVYYIILFYNLFYIILYYIILYYIILYYYNSLWKLGWGGSVGLFLWSWYRDLTVRKSSALSSPPPEASFCAFSVVGRCFMCQKKKWSLCPFPNCGKKLKHMSMLT